MDLTEMIENMIEKLYQELHWTDMDYLFADLSLEEKLERDGDIKEAIRLLEKIKN